MILFLMFSPWFQQNAQTHYIEMIPRQCTSAVRKYGTANLLVCLSIYFSFLSSIASDTKHIFMFALLSAFANGILHKNVFCCCWRYRCMPKMLAAAIFFCIEKKRYEKNEWQGWLFEFHFEFSFCSTLIVQCCPDIYCSFERLKIS